MTLFLKDEDVAQCVDMGAMLGAIESMQHQSGVGQAHNMTRRKIIAESGMLSVMGGGLFHQGLLGVKTYTVVKGSYSFQVSLYDADTEALLCYTQANRILRICYIYTDENTYTHSNSYRDAHTYCNADTHSDTNTDQHANANPNPHTDADTYRDPCSSC